MTAAEPTAADFLLALADWAMRGFNGDPPQIIADLEPAAQAEMLGQVDELKAVIATKTGE